MNYSKKIALMFCIITSLNVSAGIMDKVNSMTYSRLAGIGALYVAGKTLWNYMPEKIKTQTGTYSCKYSEEPLEIPIFSETYEWKLTLSQAFKKALTSKDTCLLGLGLLTCCATKKYKKFSDKVEYVLEDPRIWLFPALTRPFYTFFKDNWTKDKQPETVLKIGEKEMRFPYIPKDFYQHVWDAWFNKTTGTLFLINMIALWHSPSTLVQKP